MSGAGNARSSGAVKHHAHLADVLSDDFQRIHQRSARDDGRAMLVVVEDWNLHGLAERFLDLKAIGCLDIFQIDSAECGLEQLAELDDFFGIVAVHLDIKHVHVGKALEENGFAFHDGLAGKGSDVAEPEDRRSVAEYSYQVATARVFERVLRILLDLKAGLGYSRRISQAEVALRSTRFGRCDFNLSGARPIVVIEGLLLAYQHDCLRTMNRVRAVCIRATASWRLKQKLAADCAKFSSG